MTDKTIYLKWEEVVVQRIIEHATGTKCFSDPRKTSNFNECVEILREWIPYCDMPTAGSARAKDSSVDIDRKTELYNSVKGLFSKKYDSEEEKNTFNKEIDFWLPHTTPSTPTKVLDEPGIVSTFMNEVILNLKDGTPVDKVIEQTKTLYEAFYKHKDTRTYNELAVYDNSALKKLENIPEIVDRIERAYGKANWDDKSNKVESILSEYRLPDVGNSIDREAIRKEVVMGSDLADEMSINEKRPLSSKE